MELEGRKELVDTGKSSRNWSVPPVSLRLSVLNMFNVLLLLAVAKPEAHFQGFLGILECQNGPPWAQNWLKTLA